MLRKYPVSDCYLELNSADMYPRATSFRSRSHVRYVLKNRTKKLSKSSSRHFDDSVVRVHVFRSDQSAYYFTLCTDEKHVIVRRLVCSDQSALTPTVKKV